MIPFCHLDPDFAQQQLVLLLREWYMHPNGQIPGESVEQAICLISTHLNILNLLLLDAIRYIAYEFALGDVNPPVHAWAAMNVFQHTKDVNFLSRCFHKLMLNFTWYNNYLFPLISFIINIVFVNKAKV